MIGIFKISKSIILIVGLYLSSISQAMFIEMGLSHSLKKTTFSADNYIESETLSGSISFYIWEQIALETSYTQGYAVRKESDIINPVRTITQKTDIYGADLVFGLLGRSSAFQPFIKGGAAYITKKQSIGEEGTPAYTITPKPGVAPSYGIGFKIKLTETFSLSTSVDVWQTPLDDGTKTNDTATRTGITWMF